MILWTVTKEPGGQQKIYSGDTFMIMTIAAPVIVFAVIILVHEGGHYVTAKLTGMRVEEFAVGFGPVLYSRTIGETK